MTIQFKRCTEQDLVKLQEISIETFSDTFKNQNTLENLTSYLESAYPLQKLASELANESSQFLFLLVNQQLVGYLKINSGDAQTERIADNALEVERIYIRKQYKRQGYGRLLLLKAEEIALSQKRQAIWLGVWEKNVAAIAFYQKMGFNNSHHSFYLGAEEQVDQIMLKELT